MQIVSIGENKQDLTFHKNYYMQIVSLRDNK